MKVKIRNVGEFDVEGLYIESGNSEYLLKEKADGVYIIEVTDNDILVRPQTANSLVLVDKEKLK